jgi:ubiquinone/menaquinone biosynthesis C-methylase UbiE
MASSYDSTTWFYERLSKLVFGQAQVRAQNYFLSQIAPGAYILIIGGGTGKMLETLAGLHPSGLNITYVEASAKMMALSKKRNAGQNHVMFINSDIANLSFDQEFDVVITAFLFDNFSDEILADTFPMIDMKLKPGGLWLDTDFQLTGPLWQKVLLKMMYTFFKLMGAVEVTKLPDVRRMFNTHGYRVKKEKAFYGDFILARVYQKKDVVIKP